MRALGAVRAWPLRRRLFLAIAAAVVVSVALSLTAGALLVRRSLERQATKALARQVDLLVAQQRSPSAPRLSSLGLFFATEQERLTILSPAQAALLLPRGASAALRAGRPAEGNVTVRGTKYLFAARSTGEKAVILLRPARLAAADWTPFGLAFVLAGALGAALAALVAFGLAQAIARPIRRAAAASRRLARGERPGPLPVEGSDELAALAEAFNHMADGLEQARDAQRRFLLSVSHELKTPLTVIRGNAEALTEGVLGPQQVGEVIGRESQRLERLVQDLLDLARLDQRAFTIGRRTIDLGEIATETVRSCEAQARALGVSLTVEVSAGALAEGDPDRVRQVLFNLIENALRCTPSGGSVKVAAGLGGLAVEDTGPGLPAQDLARAFERFFLYGRYGRDRAVGTGLGLAIVKELTEAMGGSVAVRSEVGVGTTFEVSLPRVESDDLGPRAPSPSRPVARQAVRS